MLLLFATFSFGAVGGDFSRLSHSFGEGWQSKEQFPALALLP